MPFWNAQDYDEFLKTAAYQALNLQIPQLSDPLLF